MFSAQHSAAMERAMPAEDGFVCTCESRFIMRYVPSHDGAAHDRVRLRILQQRWVRIGTIIGTDLTSENSEWRDVPLVEES